MIQKLLSLFGLKRPRDEFSAEQSPLDCPICSDSILSCALTSCGHSFCEYCLNQSLAYSQLCPICRKPISISSYIPCKSVDTLVLSSLSLTQKKRFERRLDRFEQWKEAKKLKNSKVGMKVDALDTEGVWCVALIRLKVDNGEKYPYLYIHYIGWDKSFDEILPENSIRLAPLGFYSSRGNTH